MCPPCRFFDHCILTGRTLKLILKSLDLSNKKDEFKKINGIFPQNLINYLIRDRLIDIVNLEDIIKTDNLCYKSKN